MERLTTRNSEGVAVLKTPYQCERCGEAIYRLADYGNGEPIEKLAMYEELQEQRIMSKLEGNTNNELGVEFYNADGSARALGDVINDIQMVTRNLTTEAKGNMERLTRKSNTSSMVWFVDHERGGADREPCEMDSHHARLAITRLAEYEDLEEQGKLLKLPCAAGDTVYCIFISKGTNPVIFSQKFDYSMIEIFGKTVFLTKEQAEAALKEMQKG